MTRTSRAGLALSSTLVLSTLILVWAPSGVRAQPTGVSGSVSVQAAGLFDNADLDGATGPLADALQLGDADSDAQASLSVDFGLIRPAASASRAFEGCGGEVPCPPSTSASASGSWVDSLTITPGPVGLMGEPGAVRFRLEVGGTGFASQPGVGLPLGSFGSFFFLSVAVDETNQNATGFFFSESMGGDGFGEYPFSAPITLGESFLLQVMLETTANASPVGGDAPGTYVAEMDMSSSLRWLGIEQVTDQMGEPIAFSLSSESGTDWVLPVPEPAGTSAALAAVGALGGAAAARRPTRRRA